MVHERERCGKIEHMREENLKEDMRTSGGARNVQNKK
jgi:hypothetical protein